MAGSGVFGSIFPWKLPKIELDALRNVWPESGVNTTVLTARHAALIHRRRPRPDPCHPKPKKG
eukprot:5714981-Prymnesium_polylepis.1